MDSLAFLLFDSLLILTLAKLYLKRLIVFDTYYTICYTEYLIFKMFILNSFNFMQLSKYFLLASLANDE